ncbi:Glutathione-independent glyoxalase HSP31 [Mycena indigotica]|uniref:Glutathione-independent glyoxalase HSP31 n=1 Tax=Mycena indigotica TaxID=2126181 RepID=A0A8H6T811_9AGAR|nr:Glutathione-independent glyoxalase HSP31 [Mycena indigotica]KAF7312037.1 Glutathione-independent glyoxalase HSP31 [Mycena indigotica]
MADENAKKISDVNVDDYDAIFYTGGHGPTIDLPTYTPNIELAAKLITGHADGHSQGRTGRELREGKPWDVKVLVQGNLITGQNPASALSMGQDSEILKALNN